MTGLDSNLEALAEKEYRQDEARLRYYEQCIEKWGQKKSEAENYIDLYTDMILEIQKKRKGSHEQR